MFDAVVLAGGRASRLGGADKPAVEVGGTSLLEHVVAACAQAQRVVVVGPTRPTEHDVIWALESPPGAGPVAALAAGIVQVSAELVLVLAADLPWIAPAVPALLDAVDEAAVLVDASGRRNLLAAAWRRAALVDAVHRIPDPNGAAMRRLYDGVRCVEVSDPEGWGQDCDTWDEITKARERTDG